jgi:hypothetical protein
MTTRCPSPTRLAACIIQSYERCTDTRSNHQILPGGCCSSVHHDRGRTQPRKQQANSGSFTPNRHVLGQTNDRRIITGNRSTLWGSTLHNGDALDSKGSQLEEHRRRPRPSLKETLNEFRPALKLDSLRLDADRELLGVGLPDVDGTFPESFLASLCSAIVRDCSLTYSVSTKRMPEGVSIK